MSSFDRIRVLWSDHLGLARGKYLPARLAERGTSHCVSTFGLGYDRSMIPAPGSYLLEGLRDMQATFAQEDVRAGWDDSSTGVVVADLSMDDEPYPVSPRHALRRAVGEWEAMGYRVKLGLELEAYVLEPDGEGGWGRYSTPRAFVYGTGPGSDPAGVVTAIARTAEASMIPTESFHAEFDEGQFELTLEYGDAMRAADDAFLFRVMAREVALAHGLDLTFMGKPFAGISGNGVHVNFSLLDESGDNALIDAGTDDGLSALARQCLAGLVHHHRGMTALAAPTVNAYRRLQPAELNGYWANWGYEHRCAANRVPESEGPGVRIENRLGDGSANIYTLVATVLQAARLGVVDNLECPEPLLADGFEDVNTDVHAADNLLEALGDLEADAALCEAVGADLTANFLANKHAEWERFIAAEGEDKGPGEISAWELSEYLPYH